MDLEREHIARRCALHMAIQLDSLAPGDKEVAARSIEILKHLAFDYLIVDQEQHRSNGTSGKILKMVPTPEP